MLIQSVISFGFFSAFWIDLTLILSSFAFVFSANYISNIYLSTPFVVGSSITVKPNSSGALSGLGTFKNASTSPTEGR